MTLKFLLLILPTLVLAKIDLHIKGKFIKGIPDLKVYYEDKSDESIITEPERNTFNLTDYNLKNALELLFGKRPENVYLKTPTPHGNLFQKYNGKEITRTLIVNSVKLLKTSSKPVVLFRQFFENNTSKPIITNVAISMEVQNTVSSFWRTEGELTVAHNISYEIKLETDLGDEISFVFSSPWNKQIEQTQTITVMENKSTMKVMLEPGQTVVAQLYATKNVIQLKMEYEALLSGHIIMYYDNPYKDNNYLIVSLDACMFYTDISKKKFSREFMDIVFYTDPKPIIVDSVNLIKHENYDNSFPS